MKTFLALSVLFLAVALASPAHATTTAVARQHFMQGQAFYKQAHYDEAIREFQAAYDARPHPAVLFNLAQCYEKLGDTASALKDYREYLRQVPDAEDRAAVETIVANITAHLKDTAIQMFSIQSVPPGANLIMDSEPAGTTPVKMDVKGATHHLRFVLAGYDTVEKDVETSWEHPTEFSVTLQKQAVSLAPPDPKEDELSGAGQQVSAHPEAAQAKPRVWTWVAGGVGAAAVIAAALVGTSEQSDQNKLAQATTPLSNQQANSLANSAKNKATVANALYAVGGVGIAAGCVLFFVEEKF